MRRGCAARQLDVRKHTLPARPHETACPEHAGPQAPSGLDDRGGVLQSAIPCGFQADDLRKNYRFVWYSGNLRGYNRNGKSARQPLCVMRMEESPGPEEQDAG